MNVAEYFTSLVIFIVAIILVTTRDFFTTIITDSGYAVGEVIVFMVALVTIFITVIYVLTFRG